MVASDDFYVGFVPLPMEDPTLAPAKKRDRLIPRGEIVMINKIYFCMDFKLPFLSCPKAGNSFPSSFQEGSFWLVPMNSQSNFEL
jgi:hypothetical protein